MMPSCDQIGVPIHFHSSTTSGAAPLMSLRILLRVSPRQSPSSAILFEMSSDADWPWLAPDFFMFSSWKFQMGLPLPHGAFQSMPHSLVLVQTTCVLSSSAVIARLRVVGASEAPPSRPQGQSAAAEEEKPPNPP